MTIRYIVAVALYATPDAAHNATDTEMEHPRANRSDNFKPVVDRNRNGQAMIEFLVGLVSIVVLLAVLLQLTGFQDGNIRVPGLLTRHTDAMVEARREAGALAILDIDSDNDILFNPDYIVDWEEGPDGKRHTRDDRPTHGSPATFDQTIVDKASSDQFGWTQIDEVPNNRLTRIHGSGAPQNYFGLVKGYDSQEVELLPAIRNLLYRRDTIVIECEVWMTSTKGIY